LVALLPPGLVAWAEFNAKTLGAALRIAAFDTADYVKPDQ
jgi:hypothetical protein